ncbi:MAG: flippase [Salinibacter sp.]
MARPKLEIRHRLRDFLGILLGRSGQSGLRVHLIQGASWSFVLKVTNQALMFITSIVLARILGAEGFGLYAFVMGVVGLLGVPANLGLPQLVMRNVASYAARADWGPLRGLLTRAHQAMLSVSLGLVIVGIGGLWLFPDRVDPIMLTAFGVAFLLLPLNALNMLRSATMRGLGHVITGQIPEFLIKPLSFLILVGIAYVALGPHFSAPWALGMQVAAVGIALTVGIVLLLRRMSTNVRVAEPQYDTRAWTRSALPFLLIGGMQMIIKNTDIVMLGALVGQESAGVYKVATRGAELVTFVLFAANRTLGPTIAQLHSLGEYARLQRLVTRSARLVFLGSLPIASVLVALGPWILLLFGEDFTIGWTSLCILSTAQLINAGMGSVGLILSMTGFERVTAMGIGVGAIVNVILNAILVPMWHTEGAAVATGISLVCWNTVLVSQIFRQLRINPTVVSGVRKPVSSSQT